MKILQFTFGFTTFYYVLAVLPFDHVFKVLTYFEFFSTLKNFPQ